MEIIDFNPHIIQRRLSAEAVAQESTESGSPLAPSRDETLVEGQENDEAPEAPENPGARKPDLEDKPDGTPDPKCDALLKSRSRIETVAPSQLPLWIPAGAATRCNLPYTSYEIPIPQDLNMDFCIDVMMGQDTIVFMFVCGDIFFFRVCVRWRLISMELQDNEAGDEYTWSILSF